MELVVSTLVDLFRARHRDLREAVADLDDAALNWTPAPETNSIVVLVVHTLGSEAEVLRIARGLGSDRDRDAEFRVRGASAADLLARLDAADALLTEHGEALTADDLAAMRPRQSRPPQTGMFWLLSNYGHACEHVAHIQLTKQLYRDHVGKAG